MATLAESFLADLEDLSDDEPERETSESQDEEDDGVSNTGAAILRGAMLGLQCTHNGYCPWSTSLCVMALH